jgi:hypothetical protein
MIAQYCNAQRQEFVINGCISGLDNGTVELLPVGIYDRFREVKLDSSSFSIRNGRFVISGKMDYPYAFYIFLENDSVFLPSDIVLISPGRQRLAISADSIKNLTPAM